MKVSRYGFLAPDLETHPSDAQVLGIDPFVVRRYRENLTAIEYAEWKLSKAIEALRTREAERGKLGMYVYAPDLDARLNYTRKVIEATERFLRE